MAITNVIPDTLAAHISSTATAAQATEWIGANGTWIADIIHKHDLWLATAEVEKYQKAYDGYMESIDIRDKSRGDDTNHKLQVNYAKLIIDTVVNYMVSKPPMWTIEDTEQEADAERPIVQEYRQKMLKLLKTQQAQRVLSEQLRQGSIACYSGIICWVDEKGNIDYEDFPVQELIPVYDVRGRLCMVLRRYTISRGIAGSSEAEDFTRVEVYDDKYVTYYISSVGGSTYELDTDEIATGNPIEHKAGRIPVSIFLNGTAATYSVRLQRNGVSDLGDGIYSLLEAYAEGLSDKANLADYLQDQYLALYGVNVDEKGVMKMRKARAIAMKSKDSKAEFLAQNQEDKAVENYMNRLKDIIFDMSFTPKLNDLVGTTATEIKMKFAALDIKAGKKEVYFIDALHQFIGVLTDLLNAQLLIDKGYSSPYTILSDQTAMAARDDLYNADWLTVTLNRNLPQNYKEIADIVTELSGKVPDSYLYELLWFIDDPIAALEEMKQQNKETAEATAKTSMAALGYSGEFGNTDTSTNTDAAGAGATDNNAGTDTNAATK